MMNYFKNIDSNEVIIDFMTWEGNESAIETEILDRGSKIYYMPRLGLKNFFAVRCFYKDFFEKYANEYEIVHSHFYQMDSIIFPIAKKYGVKACISHSHNTKYSEYVTKIWRNWLLSRGITKCADYWAACSIEAGVFLYGKKFKCSKKALLVNNAIDVQKYRYNKNTRIRIRKELGIENNFVIGNVGSLKPQKNQRFLIDIFSMLRKMEDFCDSKLLIVGDGALRAELEKYVAKLNLSGNVIFTGSRNNVHELLSAMDLFIFPSLFEGLGLTLIEAQFSGLRCIASDIIPSASKISDLVSFFPLEKTSFQWASFASKMRTYDRTSFKVECDDYDISFAAKKMVNFYKSIV